jgi:hypothetical protein
VKLNAHSPTEFIAEGGKYTFALNEKGKPKGVQVLYPYSIEFMPFNDSPDEETGPNKKEWQDFVGEYSRNKVAHGSPGVSVMIKNGYLYLDRWGGLKLNEYKHGFFFTADGEAVIFQGDRMSHANQPYLKISTKTSSYIPQSTVTRPADKYADLGIKVPAQLESAYRLTLTTKRFTGTAILQLAEKDKINLDGRREICY